MIQDVLVALSVSKETSTLSLCNVDSDKFKDFNCDIGNVIEITPGDAKWWNYFLCGIKGVFEDCGVAKPVGMRCLVDGKIPNSAGLSSSSALVVSAAICEMCPNVASITVVVEWKFLSGGVWANGVEIAKEDLANLCAKAERFIGTQGQ